MTHWVSVIIPVYNAEAFVRQAVESALMQPETGEVILIEDASPDGSLQVCRDLAEQHPQVILLQHPDGKNHGAGTSRNLGIRNARFHYVAFLDADDYFLPGRFSVAMELLEADAIVDGVYEAVGTHFETPEVEEKWRILRSNTLVTMTKAISPKCLFEAQAPVGNQGYCCTDGWVVRKAVFARTGLFDEHLRLHQDSAMFVKFSAVCRMVPGRLDEAVAMRRIHEHNRITARRTPDMIYQDLSLMWGILWRWGRKNLSHTRKEIVIDRLLSCAFDSHGAQASSVAQSRALAVRRILGLLGGYPDLLLEKFFWIWHVHRLRSFWIRVNRFPTT